MTNPTSLSSNLILFSYYMAVIKLILFKPLRKMLIQAINIQINSFFIFRSRKTKNRQLTKNYSEVNILQLFIEIYIIVDLDMKSITTVAPI